MARLEVLPAEGVEDPDLRKMMEETGGDEMFGVYGHPGELPTPSSRQGYSSTETPVTKY